MKTEHVDEFIRVAHTGSLNAAAKQLFMARSVLTSHIDSLERELGFALFDRAQGAKLTPAGSMFLASAEALKSELSSTVQSCRRLAHATQTIGDPVRVAYLGASPAELEAIRSASPVPLEFVTYDHFGPFFAPLQDGIADVEYNYDYTAFASLREQARDLGLASVPTRLYRCALAVDVRSPLAAKRSDLSVDDLRGHTMLLDAAYDYELKRRLVVQAWGWNPDQPFVPLPSVSPETLATYTLGSNVLICMSEAALRPLEARDDVVLIDRIDGKPFGFQQVAIYRTGARPAVRAFVDAVANADNTERRA